MNLSGDTPSLLELIENRNKELSKKEIWLLDEQSSRIPPGPQRIRGIAGSGKTRLLCQKAAFMHKEHPEWEIAYVFFTQALYDEIHENLKRTMAGLGIPWNEKKLKILHAWGSWQRDGLYRTICTKNRYKPKGIKDTTYLYGEGLADLAWQFLSESPIGPSFDAILIDEGQDLVFQNPELQYKNRQAIYWMAYSALKIPDETRPQYRRLIWAYDEYQNINSHAIPTGKALFGEEKPYKDLLLGWYEENIPKNIIMKQCYRTPGPILLAAHAICMGLFCPAGMIAGPTTKTEWENLGYTVEGSFFPGREITLTRPEENSKNPITTCTAYPLISFEPCTFEAQELCNLADRIAHLIFTEHINPYKRILIIYLCDRKRGERIGFYLNMKGIDYYYPGNPDTNIPPVEDFTKRKPRIFWEKNCVTIAHMNQAKGNEADFVFVLGIDAVAQKDQEINERNALFTAMTRTKGFLYLSGLGEYPLYAEIMAVLLAIGNQSDTVRFTYNGTPKIPINVEET
ncbi:MAG: DEAD/DEAH box helicase [Methanospirillaceae archaeon]|nr:DEAD/DEAH box helicase [Methanospirillaceae archaeon]